VHLQCKTTTTSALLLRTFYSPDFICGYTGGVRWESFSRLEKKDSPYLYLLYLKPLDLHIWLGYLRRTNICMRFLLIFTSRKARNSIRISRTISLLLLWVPYRRRKYKSPNKLSSASLFLGLFVKAVFPTLTVDKLQTLEWNRQDGRSVGWKWNNSTILPSCRGSVILVEDSRLSCTLESLDHTNAQTYLLHGMYFWRQKREMKNLFLSLSRALFNSKMLTVLRSRQSSCLSKSSPRLLEDIWNKISL